MTIPLYEESPVGVLCANSPSYVLNPPIEAVVFAWGASEDHQLGLDTEEDIKSPKVVEALLGIQFRGCVPEAYALHGWGFAWVHPAIC